MIPQGRLSTQVVISDWLPPDQLNRALDEDYEIGPVALNDTSLGLKHQQWHLTWDFATGNFIATPEDVGSPVIVLNAANVTQCSLAFDQNAHINLAYTANGQAKLYWYDSVAANWTTDNLPAGVTTPTLCLDDKRVTQTQSSDILLWYTKQEFDETWSLYQRIQRERYLVEHKELNGTAQPYLYKLGMNAGLRLQLGMSEYII